MRRFGTIGTIIAGTSNSVPTQADKQETCRTRNDENASKKHAKKKLAKTMPNVTTKRMPCETLASFMPKTY
jgi:hypothetical protein